MSESKKYRVFEVQTKLMTGWENVWHVDDKSEFFTSRQDAEDSIHEFFADLGRAGMAQSYDLEDYRVHEVHHA